MQKLLLVDRLDFHEHPERFIPTFILANGERLTTFRGSLVYDIKFGRRILAEKVTKNEFSLGLAVRLNFAFDGYIDSLEEIPR